jgi:hypothetical protein
VPAGDGTAAAAGTAALAAGVAGRHASRSSRSFDSAAEIASSDGRAVGSGAKQAAASVASALGVPGGKLGFRLLARR